MTDFLDRMIEERLNLEKKIDAAQAFVSDSVKFRKMKAVPQDLLKAQIASMGLYLSVLIRRINYETRQRKKVKTKTL